MNSCMNCRWCSCRNYGKENSGTCMYYIEDIKTEKIKEATNKPLDNDDK